MANETPKKPIRRVTVPKVSKEVSTSLPKEKKESKVGQNLLLFVLFIIVSGVIYLAIFQRKFLAQYMSSDDLSVKSDSLVSDSLNVTPLDSIGEEEEEFNTIIGQDKIKRNKNTSGNTVQASRYYLVASTFIFYPYAEKCRDQLRAAGYNADIISTGEPRKFHRVYIESSEDPALVRAKRDEMLSQGKEVWVYGE